MIGKHSGRTYRHTIRARGKKTRLSFGGGGSLSFPDIFSFFKGGYYRNATIIKVIAAALIIGFIIMLGVDYYNVRQLAEFQPNVTTQIYDKNKVLVSELFWQKRDVVPYSNMPPDLVHAFIAMEDNDFYDHFGINPKGIVRAFFVNIASGRLRQGGSTITQQLAKILLTNQKRNLFRKAKEACIAVMIDATYSKNKIMEMYLNQIFLGHSAYGVETASKFYFKKHVKDLNTAECALLASLPSSPQTLSPIKYPERAMRVHRIALARMVNMGFLTRKQAEDAYMNFWPDYLRYVNELPPTMNAFSERIDRAPWFTEYIRRRLVEKYGEDMVYNKGLTVYTTLDVKKQEAAERVMRDALKRQSFSSKDLAFKRDDLVIEQVTPVADMFSILFGISPISAKGTLLQKKINDYFQENVLEQFDGLNFLIGNDPVGGFVEHYRTNYLQEKEFQNVEGALITIDHNTGYIEAMVGGSQFTTINQLNRAVQSRRQSGSSIKPLLYAAAFETKQFTPATAVLDSPIVYLDQDGGDWIPENYDGEYYGLVRLRSALAKSINVVSIRIAEKIGIDTVMKFYAKFLHFNDAEKKARIQRNFSIALGSVEVSPLELARAYGIIARGGTDFIPFAIRKIEDKRGKVLEDPESEVIAQMEKRKSAGLGEIIRPDTAQAMISMLCTVMSSGTGLSASIGRPAGGKTGTTNSWKDAWFVGFTPDVTTCVWIGYDRLGMSLGVGQSGGVVAAPVWGAYMRQALEGDPVRDFPVYGALESAEVCERSGLKPSPNCKSVITEVFVPGTVPDKICDIDNDSSGAPAGIHRKGPKEDIVKGQKEQVQKRRKGKSSTDHIGNDLLE
ncbi:MAG TPA: PBP1A family penicillin-binding protein [Spirochaetota bacterium]